MASVIRSNGPSNAAKPSSGGRPAAAAPAPASLELDGPWRLEFTSPVGSPEPLTLSQVGPWTRQPDPAVRYFSGTGTYRKTFTLPADWNRSGERTMLDLGQLWAIGEVWLNGQSLGVLWTPPFRVECTAALRAGENELVVEVINTWHNRLVGDARGETPRATRTNITVSQRKPWRELAPIASGLFGPVRLLRE